MRIAIIGASGRVGSHLISNIERSPNHQLAAAVVSSSHVSGDNTNGPAHRKYVAMEQMNPETWDMVIDFSKPDGTMELLRHVEGYSTPMVIGTTGFDETQNEEINTAALTKPILLSANFALGFELFAKAAIDLAKALPLLKAGVSEVYHARKKNEPSGTSKRLANDLAETLNLNDIPIDVQREGEVVGINKVSFNIGPVDLDIAFRVHDLNAYAEGAIQGAQLLQGKPNGLYGLHDLIFEQLA